jgi:hypothetical protein
MDPFDNISYTFGPRFIDGFNIDADVDASFAVRAMEIEISDVHPYKYFDIELPRVYGDQQTYGPTGGDYLNRPTGPGGGGAQVAPDLKDLEVRVGNLEAQPNLGYDE